MTAPPDLCVMGYDLRASGVVRNALRIAGAAQQAGLATELWVARDDGPMRAEVPDGVTLRKAPERRHSSSRTRDLARSLPALAAYLGDVRPRIALSSGNHMHVAAALGYRLAGRPRGVALWARASNATLQHPVTAYLGRPLPGPVAKAVSAMNRLQYVGFDHIIAVCHELADQLTGELGLPSQRITVIPNGVDMASIAAKAAEPLDHPWMEDGEPPVIISAGRLSRQKNFADLIHMLGIVRRGIPARLVLLGEGSSTMHDELQALASRLGLADAVLLAGFDPNPYRWMSRAAIFAISSRWEGASNVALEALVCGVPVVAYRCPTGIAEVIEPVGRDYVVPPGDVEALADAVMRRLSAPRDSAAIMAHAARFDLSVTLRSYVAAFRRELGQ